VFVADLGNFVIRKITPAGVVTTLAGTAGMRGSVDGVGAAARFEVLTDLAIDGAGNLYAADFGANVIRKITPAGVVTTLAGTPERRSGRSPAHALLQLGELILDEANATAMSAGNSPKPSWILIRPFHAPGVRPGAARTVDEARGQSSSSPNRSPTRISIASN